jgi:hypothetical protein
MLALALALASASAGCHCGGGGGNDAGSDVETAEVATICPAATPLRCNGQCTAQDSTHCATCTDVCAAGLSCQFGQCLCAGDGGRLCDGGCIDVTRDPMNCGICGRSCSGAACSGGACGPVVLAQAELPWGVATDGTNVYYTVDVGDGGAVMSVSAEGGAPSIVAAPESSPQDIVVQAGQVFWTEAPASAWRVMTLMGTLPLPLFAGSGAPVGLVVDGQPSLYWIENDANGSHTVWTGSFGGGTPTAIDGPIAGVLGGIASTLGFVYWTLPGSNAVVGYDVVNRQGSVLTPIQSPQQIAADSVNVYVTNSMTADSVIRADVGSGATTVLAQNIASPQGIAVDKSYVYVSSASGSVSRIPIDGGALETIASGQDNPWVIAVDDRAVYWTNHADAGAVMKLLK